MWDLALFHPINVTVLRVWNEAKELCGAMVALTFEGVTHELLCQ